ncbi:MAG: hypothetical protein IJW40_08455 [Clostridia bacterium]|nr:hypothetical protein [Clostridia bacterium]
MKHDLDQMLRAVEKTDPPQPYRVNLRAQYRRPASRLRLAIPAAALLVLSLLVALTLIPWRQATTPADDDPIDPLPTDDERPLGDPADLPPWRNGKLTVRALTYAASTARTLASFAEPTLIPLSEEETMPTSQSVRISLNPSVSVSRTDSAFLLRICPDTGEHAACEAVYYDISTDEVFCLSCELYGYLIDEPLYLDAWVRAILEEGITTGRIFVESDYARLYQAMYDAGLPQLLSSFIRPTPERLGVLELMQNDAFSMIVVHEKILRQRLEESTMEPHIEIINYGVEQRQCLFSLVPSYVKASYCYGTYLFDFETKKLTRLEGDSIGVARCLGSDEDSSQKGTAINMTRALSIYYMDGYKMITATVPWQLPHHSPEYTVVCVNTVTGEITLPFTTALSSFNTRLTNTPAIVQNGILINEFAQIGGIHNDKCNGYGFFDLHGMNTMVSFGARTHLMSLEHLFWVDGEAYAKMHLGTDEYYKEESYVYFRLRDGEMVTALFDNGTLVVPDYVYYTYRGVTRTDTRTGETVTLYDGEVLTSVCSTDERYLYLLPDTADRIVCIDRRTGETGEIALPYEFSEQLTATGATRYALYLNHAEDTLTVLFTPRDMLRFDGAAFLESDYEAGFLTRLYAGDVSAAFAYAAERMLPYYRRNDAPLGFTNEPLVREALALLAQREYDAFVAQHGRAEPSQILLTAAERLLSHLTRDGETATVTAATLAELKEAGT